MGCAWMGGHAGEFGRVVACRKMDWARNEMDGTSLVADRRWLFRLIGEKEIFRIRKQEVPSGTLLEEYGSQGNYVDCYKAEMPDEIAFVRFVEAFYSSTCFKPERFLLRALLGKPSTVEDIRALAEGRSDHFAAWTVEGRSDRELLLCDFQQATRSWLMLTKREQGGAELWFGTAVVLRSQGMSISRQWLALVLTIVFGGFHRLYSRALLWGAVKQLS